LEKPAKFLQEVEIAVLEMMEAKVQMMDSF
jgi:hypothetical protein